MKKNQNPKQKNNDKGFVSVPVCMYLQNTHGLIAIVVGFNFFQNHFYSKPFLNVFILNCCNCFLFSLCCFFFFLISNEGSSNNNGRVNLFCAVLDNSLVFGYIRHVFVTLQNDVPICDRVVCYKRMEKNCDLATIGIEFLKCCTRFKIVSKHSLRLLLLFCILYFDGRYIHMYTSQNVSF